ncbi:MAG: efflux RND transporter permease subunit [Myxococcota bacterium]
MSLTELAISRDRITAIATLLILVSGTSTYFSMPRDEDPGFLIRVATVRTMFPGASPTRVEQLVTDRIETAVRQIPELEKVTSQSREGISLVTVELRDEIFDLQPVWDDLRRKVEAIEGDLPDGIQGPFVDDEVGDVYGILISVTGPGYAYRDLYEVAKDTRDELLLLVDAAKVEIYGAQEERIFLEFTNTRLAEYGLSPAMLKDILAAQNILSAGGSVVVDSERLSLEPTGNFETQEQLAEAAIAIPSGELVPLRDMVDVRRGYIDPPRVLRRANGAPALGLAVSMRDGGNLIELGEQVTGVLDRVRPRFPLGIELELAQFQPEIVSRKVSEFESNLLQSVAIVAGVMLITLGLRTGLIVASLVPSAMVFAIAVMGGLEIGLDQMSLAALIIALGMLVDNAIVMSESIMVQMAAGKRAVAAAVDSAKELAVPLLTSSLTTAAAFLPIYLAENASGEYTAPIFKVVTITLLCSWLVSLTLIPLLCVRFLRVEPQDENFETPFYRRYRGVLATALRRPWLSLAAMVGVLFFALFCFRFLPNIFFPDNDRPLLVGEFAFPFGTAIEHTAEATTRIESYIQENLRVDASRSEGVTDWVTYVGDGGPRFTLGYNSEESAPYIAAMLINATNRETSIEAGRALETWANESFPGLKATVRPLQTGPGGWPPIQIEIAGRELDPLFAIVDEVKQQLRETPGTRLIDDDWGAQAKKLVIRIDQERARRAGLTSQDVAVSLQSYLSGLEATDFREGEELIPITLRSAVRGRADLGALESINVSSQASGTAVPLKQIADVEPVWEPGIIRRRDRLRTVTVEAAPTAGVTSAEIVGSLAPWLEARSAEWPQGYAFRFAGEFEDSSAANDAIGEKLPIAGLAIAMLLVLQFNSLRKPTIILLTIPFGLIGVVFGLLVARSYFGFMTLLGVISLSGIIINNAIVLIDRIQIELDGGLTPFEAVLQAAQRRLRPILLTTATTAGGLIPLWLGGGPMFEPMAIAILFGLLFGTALTLGLVPILYTIFYRVETR